MSRLTSFNAKMDGVISRLYNRSLYSPEMREQFTVLVGHCRRIAEYDVELAQEVFADALLLSYLAEAWAIGGMRSRQ